MSFVSSFFFLIPIAHNPKCVSLSEDVAISRRLLKISHLKLIEIRFGEDGVRKSIWNGCELWKQIPHWLAFALICSCVNKESTGGKWKLLQCCWKVRSAVEEPRCTTATWAGPAAVAPQEVWATLEMHLIKSIRFIYSFLVMRMTSCWPLISAAYLP